MTGDVNPEVTPTEEIKLIKELIERKKYPEALQTINNLEQTELTDDERIVCQFQKCEILLERGDPERVLEIVHDIVLQDKTINDQLFLIDAIILKSRALKRVGKLTESLAIIRKGLQVLKGVESSGELVIQTKKASILYQIGTILRHKGDFDEALKNIKQSLVLREEIGNEKDIVRTLYYLGVIYREKWNFKKGLYYTQKSLAKAEKLDLKDSIAYCYWNLGSIYYYRLDLDLSLDFMQKALILSKELDDKIQMTAITGMIGEIYKEKGEMELALEYLQESITALEEHGFFGLGYATYTSILGEVYISMGEEELAFENLEKAIMVYGFIGSQHQYITRALAFLIRLGIETNNLERITPYIEQLKQLNEEIDNPLLSQVYQIVQANLLKMSTRYRDKAKAQDIFRRLIAEENVYHMVTRYALIDLCDLLMEEFRTMGDEKILNEINDTIENLMQKAKQSSSYSLLAEIHYLQSKLALTELDLDKAQQLLQQAKLIADEKGISRLSMIVSLEHQSLLTQLSKWERIIAQKPSQREMLELTQFEELVDRMLHNRLYLKEEEIREYAEHARNLVEKWEKD